MSAWNVKLKKRHSSCVWKNDERWRRKRRENKEMCCGGSMKNVDIMKAEMYRANVLLFHIIKKCLGMIFTTGTIIYVRRQSSRARERTRWVKASDDLCENITKAGRHVRVNLQHLTVGISRWKRSWSDALRLALSMTRRKFIFCAKVCSSA